MLQKILENAQDLSLVGLALISIYLLYIVYKKAISLAKLEKDFEQRVNLEADFKIKSDTLNAQILDKDTNISALNQSLNNLKAQNLLLDNNVNTLKVNIQEYKNDIIKKEQEILSLHAKNTDLTSTIARLESQIESLKKLASESDRRHEIANKELEQRLNALSFDLIQKSGKELQFNSLNTLSKAVTPLKEELSTFRDFLTKTQKISSEQTGELKNELLRLKDAQLTLSEQANDLAKALKSGGKSQGMWGEHQLELVLQNSGLREGFEYKREVVGDRSLHEMGRADVLIVLPEGKSIIIDAKCSLTSYTNYINADTKEDKEKALKAHILSIKAHIEELKKARYDEYKSFNSPTFTFMFVPIDNALTQALENSDSLYNLASSNNIYLVSPQTLMPALKVVSNLWVLATQNERVKDIVNDALNIYKKAILVKEAFDDSQKKLNQMQDSFSTAKNRLYEGKGNLCSLLESFSNKPVSFNKETIIDIKDKEDKVSLSEKALDDDNDLEDRKDNKISFEPKDEQYQVLNKS